MADVMIEFQDTKRLHDTQEHRLGYVGRDGIGQKWSYVQFREVVGVGERVRDSIHSDLITTDDPGTVAVAAAVGTDVLEDTGKFPISSDLGGCVGAIVVGTGAGQHFTVMSRIDSDKLRVKVLTSPTGFSDRVDGGWHTALDTTSRYRLFFPGAVRQGDGISDIVRGYTQVAVTTDDLNKYGWVQQTGIGFKKLDVSADGGTDRSVLSVGDRIVAAAAGLAHGDPVIADAYSNTGLLTDIKELVANTGQSLFGDYTPTADCLMWSALNVVNEMQSYRLDHATHVFAKPGQRIT